MSVILSSILRARRISPFVLLLGGYAMFIAVAYLLIFALLAHLPVPSALESALVNSVPVLVLGLAVRELLLRFVFGRSAVRQAASHLLLGAFYSLLLYWVVLSAFAVLRGQEALGFIVKPFPDAAGAWQLVHGVSIYALVAALAWIDRLIRSKQEPEEAKQPDGGRHEPRQRLLLRQGDEIVPIEVADIVCVTGADDYAEVVLTRGRHLSRMSLADFEEELSAPRFIRVHRSHIVNIDRLVRAEPAGGGRMMLHMESGQVVPASRTGARLLRERMV